MSSSITRDETQKKFLQKATESVQEHAFRMKRAMDRDDLMTTLKSASEILRELRTSLLTPKNYYSLYMQVLDELNQLEAYFADYVASSKGKKAKELYEQVQTCGNVLPRLYLLLTIGSVFIKSKEGVGKDILKDMVEMVKGVQHPMRGLFLRHYLSVVSKDKFPDKESEYGDDIHASIDFFLQNFAEANRLWVRMQHQTAITDKKQCEKERHELRVLVGISLVRLSQVEGITAELYAENVLPDILKQVISCKDRIAQQYLMDCIIQVFPDDFHLATLKQFLTACTELQQQVDVATIITPLMERIANYYRTNPDQRETMSPEVFCTFKEYTDELTKKYDQKKAEEDSSTHRSLNQLLTLQSSLMRFCVDVYANNIEFMEQCTFLCADFLSRLPKQTIDGIPVKPVEDLLMCPLSAGYVVPMLRMNALFQIVLYLPWKSHKDVSVQLVHAILDKGITLDNSTDLEKLLQLISPLLKDDPRGTSVDSKDEFEEEQNMIAKLVHLISNDDPDITFKMYGIVRKYFGQGGIKRVCHTLIPLVFGALVLTRTLYENEVANIKRKTSPRKVLQFVHEIVTALTSSYHSLALRLFLQCALTADSCRYDTIAYEFITQAFIIYEDEMTDSMEQQQALDCIIGSLLCCKNITEDNYDTLVTKTTQYAAKLLKKSDQCRMVAACAHLFWVGKPEGDIVSEKPKHFDGGRVLECLKRSLKTADVATGSSVSNISLFVDVLDHYLYFLENQTPQITKQYIAGLVALVKEHLENMDDGSSKSQVEAHYMNTIKHIEAKNLALD